MKQQGMKPALRCMLFIFLLGGGVPLFAQQARIDDTRADLEALKQRLEALQKNVTQTAASRTEAMNALADVEREVSRVQRAVRQLTADKLDAERKLALLEAEQRAVETRIEQRQDELADWLRRYYIYGAADGVAPLLLARDPNQLARDVYYMEHLGRARFVLIESLRADLRQKAAQAEEIVQRRDHVLAMETEQRDRQKELEEAQATRKQALSILSEQLKAQQKEVAALQQDEERLTKLIETLARRAREEAERQAAEARRQAAEQARAAAKARQQGGGTGRAEPIVGEVRHTPVNVPQHANFAQLRGQLRFPVQGTLVGRFGALRAEGGTTWKGVFIRATNGSDVRAVAAGEVVFSDWLRGYGNLLIIDHGNNYLSVYGNNDALLKVVGERVAGGDSIASVGSSGGGPESGLYFEIRHQGLPQDPLLWVKIN